MDAAPPEDVSRYWVLLVGFLAIAACFSAAETAFVSLGRIRVRRLRERHPRAGAVVERLAGDPDRVLSAILFGNNLANSAASSAATVIAISLFPEHPILVATVGVTALLLVFAEITPKVIAAARPERVVLLAAPADPAARAAPK